jgi:ribosomal protein S18 acetylase RimI-like enzyme
MFSNRTAISQDFPEIAKFPQDARELFFMYPRGTYPITADQLEDIASTRIKPTVVLHNDKAVGYCNFYEVSEESCWLGNLIISPSYRGKGVGKYLIEVMQDYARSELGLKNFRLVCHNINTNALLFYIKLGFKPFDFNIQNDNEGKQVVGIKMEIKL